MHYFSKMPLLLLWYSNRSRSTYEDNLIAQFFEMISTGTIKEALLQMQLYGLLFTVYFYDYTLCTKINCLLGIADSIYYYQLKIN